MTEAGWKAANQAIDRTAAERPLDFFPERHQPRRDMSVPTTSEDVWRDRAACWLANQALRLATPRYRALLAGSVEYGLRAAARDVVDGRPDPRWPVVEDGLGNSWPLCRERENCRLEVVRPGKVQCDCDAPSGS